MFIYFSQYEFSYGRNKINGVSCHQFHHVHLNTTHIIFMNIKYLNICPSKLYKYYKEKHGKSCSSKFYFSMPNDVRY